MSNFLFPESQQSWEDNNPINILPVSSNVVNIALTGAKFELQKFFAVPTALEKLDRVFDITDPSAAHILIEYSAAGIFEQIPPLQIVNDAAMNGAQGAFSQATNTIYLSDSLVRGDSLKIQEVLLEELGHKFDTLLNPGGDTSGDEGELFKHVVLGLPLSDPELLRIQTENDFGTVVIDNQVISVEQAQNSMADAIVSNDDGVYIRRSDGSQFLPTEKWTDIGYLGTKGTWFADVTGDGKADAIVSNDEGVYKGVYVRRSDGSQFLPTEKWTDIAYWGTEGTWFADVTLPPGYYRELSSLSETQWDEQSGDNNQFEQYPLGGGGDQRGKTDDRIEEIYTDLSKTIFGDRVPMTTGYAYDQSYYSSNGTWHAGLDMGATDGATIKAAVGGTVEWIRGSGDGYVFVGINSDDGRQWVYGHLKSSNGLWENKRINAGENVGLVGWYDRAPHLHLEVQNGQAYGNTQGAMSNRDTLLSVTVSPLMAYWQWRNR